jgi:hypothetical protein
MTNDHHMIEQIPGIQDVDGMTGHMRLLLALVYSPALTAGAVRIDRIELSQPFLGTPGAISKII